LIILLLTIVSFLIYLMIERALVERRLKAIPLRISVTGIRGKTTVVRMVAAMLRASGQRVLAKTTGSEAKYILPDGSEQEVRRRGMPTILEQKQLLKKAVQLHATCIVAEIMSIHPENHFIESQQLLRPNIVLLTNIRPDHIDAMGWTEDQIASVLCLDLPRESKLFILASELRPPIVATCQRSAIELISISDTGSKDRLTAELRHIPAPLLRHVALVSELGRHIGIDEGTILSGIQSASADIGGLKIWKYRPVKSNHSYYFVNAFAANDPKSSLEILLWVREHLPASQHNWIGLLNLRGDRGDRTLQWIDALRNDPGFHFHQLFVIGSHTNVVKRRIPSIRILKANQPDALTNALLAQIAAPSVIFGCGNIAGLGRSLVNHWSQIGEAYEI